MDFEPLLSVPLHPAIAEAVRYFQVLAPGDTLPKRHDFRPTRVPGLFGFYFLLDVLEDGKDYRFSLTGERVSLLFGTDGTHKRLSEIGDEPHCARLKKTYDAVVASRSFQYVRGRYVWPERAINIERLLLPMASNDGHLDTILGVTVPDTPLDMLNLCWENGAATLEIDTTITGASASR
jgi:hypothetical protein